MAASFVEFYRQKISNNIDDPGWLFSSLLLMGDRAQANGSVAAGLFSEPNNLFGAGRLKLRKFSTSGMDNAFEWSFSSVCIDDDYEQIIHINNGQTLPNDADVFKAAIFWYDVQHETGAATDRINLDLLDISTGQILAESNDWDDNKERVFYRDVGGHKPVLRIIGEEVTADNAGCGNNSQLVYIAWYWEDGDRDDSDGYVDCDYIEKELNPSGTDTCVY